MRFPQMGQVRAGLAFFGLDWASLALASAISCNLAGFFPSEESTINSRQSIIEHAFVLWLACAFAP